MYQHYNVFVYKLPKLIGYSYPLLHIPQQPFRCELLSCEKGRVPPFEFEFKTAPHWNTPTFQANAPVIDPYKGLNTRLVSHPVSGGLPGRNKPSWVVRFIHHWQLLTSPCAMKWWGTWWMGTFIFSLHFLRLSVDSSSFRHKTDGWKCTA